MNIEYFVTFAISWNSIHFDNRYISLKLLNLAVILIEYWVLPEQFEFETFDRFVALSIIADDPDLSFGPNIIFIF